MIELRGRNTVPGEHQGRFDLVACHVEIGLYRKIFAVLQIEVLLGRMIMDAILLHDRFGGAHNDLLAVATVFSGGFEAQFFKFCFDVLPCQFKFWCAWQAALHAVVGQIGDMPLDGFCGDLGEWFFQVFGKFILSPTGGNNETNQDNA